MHLRPPPRPKRLSADPPASGVVYKQLKNPTAKVRTVTLAVAGSFPNGTPELTETDFLIQLVFSYSGDTVELGWLEIDFEIASSDDYPIDWTTIWSNEYSLVVPDAGTRQSRSVKLSSVISTVPNTAHTKVTNTVRFEFPFYDKVRPFTAGILFTLQTRYLFQFGTLLELFFLKNMLTIPAARSGMSLGLNEEAHDIIQLEVPSEVTWPV